MAENKTGMMGELGYTGLTVYSGLPQEHWITALYTHSKRIQKYDEMYRYDPTVSAMISTTSMFMSQTDINVEAASTSRADMEAAEFLESNLTDMTKSWQEIMADIVLFMVYGFFDSEIVYWKRDGTKSQFDDGRIGWRKWAPRHPTTLLNWEFDENWGLKGMVQQGPPAWKTVSIPIEKLLHFTTTGMGKGNPSGSSLLEGAYTSWFYIKNLTIQQAITIERMGGTPYITLPEGATQDATDSNSDSERAKKLVRNIKTAEDMGLVLPHGFEFGYATPGSGPTLDSLAVILNHRRDLARTLLMDFIMLGGGDQGSWAMHSDKSSMYIRSLGSMMKKVTDVINRHGVPRLFALNAFPGLAGLPHVYFTPITKIDISGFAEVIERLFRAGGVTYDMGTENAIRRVAGLPEITEPGLTFSHPYAMEAGGTVDGKGPEEGQDDETGQETSEEEGDTQEEGAQFAEGAPGLGYQEAVAATDRVAKQLLAAYDETIGNLSQNMAQEEDEDRWEELAVAALALLATKMVGILRRSVFTVWDRTTNRDTSLAGLKAILDELTYQDEFIRNSLGPTVRDKILAERRRLRNTGLSTENLALALAGVVAGIRYRMKLYSGAVYKIWANAANPTAIFKRIADAAQRTDDDVRREWPSGRIVGENVQARYDGPSDERTCPDCSAVMDQGWIPAARIPLIGSLVCDGSCRHAIVYKYKGRIYR